MYFLISIISKTKCIRAENNFWNHFLYKNKQKGQKVKERLIVTFLDFLYIYAIFAIKDSFLRALREFAPEIELFLEKHGQYIKFLW